MQNEPTKIQWNDLNEMDNYFFEQVGLMTDRLESVEVSRYDRTCGHKLLQALESYVGLPASYLRLTAGADGALALLFLFLRKKNITLLIPQNSYAGFEIIAQRLQCDYIKYNPSRLADSLKKRNPEQMALVVCSPNNPTGEVSKSLLQAAQKFQGFKIMDEAYYEFSPKESFVGHVHQDEKLFIVRTFSKAFAAAGARLGYVIGQPSTLQLLNDSLDPYAVSTLSVHYGTQLLDKQEIMQKRVGELKQLTQELIKKLKAVGYSCSSSQTHFFVIRFDHLTEMQTAYNRLSQEGFIFARYEENLSLRIMVDSEDSQKAILRILGDGTKC